VIHSVSALTIGLATEELPGIPNRTEVVNIEYQQISPVENAIHEVNKASKALRSLTISKEDQQVDSKYLGTAINGAVDSPVNGGIKLYRSVRYAGRWAMRR